MKFLIVEDEIATGNYLKKGCCEAGFIVDLANNGLDGYHLAMTEEYDLIILDIMLPDVDGLKILKSIRDAQKQTPVLLLSALGDVNDKVKGLEQGADDYLVKPFDFAELLARIRTILRRGSNKIIDSLQIADIELNVTKRKVSRAGVNIMLTNQEFNLLELLIRHQGEVLPRSLIASQVWDMNFDSNTNVIDVAIRRLRSKIDTDNKVKLIHSVRGMGYVLEIKNA